MRFLASFLPCPPLCPSRMTGGVPLVIAAHPLATAFALMLGALAPRR